MAARIVVGRVMADIVLAIVDEMAVEACRMMGNVPSR